MSSRKSTGNREFSARFAYVVEYCGLTQEELARKIGLTPNTLSRIRRGRTRLTEENARKIGEETGFWPAWLFTGQGPMRVDEPEAHYCVQELASVNGTNPGQTAIKHIRIPVCGICHGEVRLGARACPHCGTGLAQGQEGEERR